MKPKSVISSISNPQIKNLISLQKKVKARDEQGIFVVEGIKMFEEAKQAGLLIKAYASESFYDSACRENPEYFSDTDFEILTDSVFKEASETLTPQGIMGTVKKAQYSPEDMIKTADACLLLLEDIRDPGNLGTMIRTAEGAGMSGVILSGSSVDIYNPKVIRSTMGSIFRVPFYYTEKLTETILELKEKGVTVYAPHLSGVAYDSEDNFKNKSAILIGNEANGLSREASEAADTLIKIPMSGKVESLNAAVAAAVLMYEAARQTRHRN
jgi:TrmH family RNA methyltransferase